MARVLVSLTPAESKRLIAKGIAALPEVAAALKHGKVLLKGGTTVSALSEELGGEPLRISGRVSARGTLASVAADPARPHTLLLEKGKARNVDAELTAAVRGLGAGDVAVVGANAIDAAGGAAMMAGSNGGGSPGEAWTSLQTEGAAVIVAAGLEKLIPGTIADAVAACGRKSFDASVGMAIGLMPVFGRVFTELDALAALAAVKATVVGKGGVFGGEGSTVVAVEGEKPETDRIFELVLSLKGSAESAEATSVAECEGPNPNCARHLACVYRSKRP